MSKSQTNVADEVVTITPPNQLTVAVMIIGTAPLIVNRFSEKSKNMMLAQHVAGSTERKGKKREPKNIEALVQEARYISEEGWDGINAGGLRQALIRTCAIVEFKMTLGKQSLFVLADGFDASDATPLIRIIGDEPEVSSMTVRNSGKVADVRIRPLWRRWKMLVRVNYDADLFSMSDVVNLLHRAGIQNGLCEGRPFSKNSCGMGYGTFRLETEEELRAREEEEKHANIRKIAA